MCLPAVVQNIRRAHALQATFIRHELVVERHGSNAVEVGGKQKKQKKRSRAGIESARPPTTFGWV